MAKKRPPALLHEKNLRLSDVLDKLFEQGWITLKQKNWLRGKSEENHRNHIHPLTAIAELGWISSEASAQKLTIERLTRWLAKTYDMEYIHIDPLKTDFAALTPFVSYAYASRFNILPVAVDDKLLTIATAQPEVNDWQQELETVLKKQIKTVLASPKDIDRYLHDFYALRRSIQGAGDDDKLRIRINSFEQLLELGGDTENEAGEQHIVQIVDWLLQYAFEQRASDIHMEPRREQGNIRFRIDGRLHLVHDVPPNVMAAMTSRLKLLGRLNLAERRRPQDGRIRTKVPETDKTVELRLSTMPTAFGEKLVMRIFDPEVIVKNFAALGFTKHDTENWQEMVKRPHGVVLVTGPTGSGKTSTLYSSLRKIYQPEINICTIEDPIEIVDEHFNQMQVQHNIDVDFATGVRTLLRQDPDVIMVGEIRDQETAEVCIQAALTGHLVLSTLHTNDSPSAVTRLIDIGVPPYLINAAVIGILAQRLVRTLCPVCKTAVAPDPVLWASLTQPHKPPLPEKVYEPVGCEECRHTGFKGRIGLYEVMRMSPEIEKIIVTGADLGQIRHTALKQGLRQLRLSGAGKIAAGVTSFEEVLRIVALDHHSSEPST